MKVLIFGANGQIGQQVVENLQKSDEHTPVAFVRKDEQLKKFEAQGVEAKLGNLEDDVDEIKKRIDDDVDAVVFTAGSGGSTGLDKTLLIDLDGAIKTVRAAKESGINRFIIVSAYISDDRSSWNEGMAPYYVAKQYADLFLENSGLEYTILRPGLLENKEGTGQIQIANVDEVESKDRSIPRADVAQSIVEILDEKSTYQKQFNIFSGDTAIKEAFKAN